MSTSKFRLLLFQKQRNSTDGINLETLYQLTIDWPETYRHRLDVWVINWTTPWRHTVSPIERETTQREKKKKLTKYWFLLIFIYKIKIKNIHNFYQITVSFSTCFTSSTSGIILSMKCLPYTYIQCIVILQKRMGYHHSPLLADQSFRRFYWLGQAIYNCYIQEKDQGATMPNSSMVFVTKSIIYWLKVVNGSMELLLRSSMAEGRLVNCPRNCHVIGPLSDRKHQVMKIHVSPLFILRWRAGLLLIGQGLSSGTNTEWQHLRAANSTFFHFELSLFHL
jgi:hypothetical protein